MVGKGDGVFHEPEPALVVPVIEVLGGDVLDGLLGQVLPVLAEQVGFDVLVEPRLVPERHPVEVGRLKRVEPVSFSELKKHAFWLMCSVRY